MNRGNIIFCITGFRLFCSIHLNIFRTFIYFLTYRFRKKFKDVIVKLIVQSTRENLRCDMGSYCENISNMGNISFSVQHFLRNFTNFCFLTEEAMFT